MCYLLRASVSAPVCLFALKSMLSMDSDGLGDVALKWSLLKTLIALPACLLTLAWLYPPAGDPDGAAPEQPARARTSRGRPRTPAWNRRRPPGGAAGRGR